MEWPGLQPPLHVFVKQFVGRPLQRATHREVGDLWSQQSHHCIDCGDGHRDASHAIQQPHSHVLLGQVFEPVRQLQLTE
jgi:hypothetical protein